MVGIALHMTFAHDQNQNRLAVGLTRSGCHSSQSVRRGFRLTPSQSFCRQFSSGRYPGSYVKVLGVLLPPGDLLAMPIWFCANLAVFLWQVPALPQLVFQFFFRPILLRFCHELHQLALLSQSALSESLPVNEITMPYKYLQVTVAFTIFNVVISANVQPLALSRRRASVLCIYQLSVNTLFLLGDDVMVLLLCRS